MKRAQQAAIAAARRRYNDTEFAQWLLGALEMQGAGPMTNATDVTDSETLREWLREHGWESPDRDGFDCAGFGAMLGVAERTVRRWLAAGSVPPWLPVALKGLPNSGRKKVKRERAEAVRP